MSMLFPDRAYKMYTKGEELFELCTQNIPHMVCEIIKNNTTLLLHISAASVPLSILHVTCDGIAKCNLLQQWWGQLERSHLRNMR